MGSPLGGRLGRWISPVSPAAFHHRGSLCGGGAGEGLRHCLCSLNLSDGTYEGDDTGGARPVKGFEARRYHEGMFCFTSLDSLPGDPGAPA